MFHFCRSHKPGPTPATVTFHQKIHVIPTAPNNSVASSDTSNEPTQNSVAKDDSLMESPSVSAIQSASNVRENPTFRDEGASSGNSLMCVSPIANTDSSTNATHGSGSPPSSDRCRDNHPNFVSTARSDPEHSNAPFFPDGSGVSIIDPDSTVRVNPFRDLTSIQFRDPTPEDDVHRDPPAEVPTSEPTLVTEGYDGYVIDPDSTVRNEDLNSSQL